jgi:hypothetical protein
VDGFGWWLGVGLCMDGGAGWFIEVTLSGSSSSLEYSGRQMLGLNSRGLSSLEHKGGNGGRTVKVQESTMIINVDGDCSQVSHQ